MCRTVSWMRRRPASSGIRLQHGRSVAFEDRDLAELLELEQAGAQPVVDVVVVVGDLVGEVGDLRFERRPAFLEEALADVAELARVARPSSA